MVPPDAVENTNTMWITPMVFTLANSFPGSFPQLSTIRIVWKVKKQGLQSKFVAALQTFSQNP